MIVVLSNFYMPIRPLIGIWWIKLVPDIIWLSVADIIIESYNFLLISKDYGRIKGKKENVCKQ